MATFTALIINSGLAAKVASTSSVSPTTLYTTTEDKEAVTVHAWNNHNVAVEFTLMLNGSAAQHLMTIVLQPYSGPQCILDGHRVPTGFVFRGFADVADKINVTFDSNKIVD